MHHAIPLPLDLFRTLPPLRLGIGALLLSLALALGSGGATAQGWPLLTGDRWQATLVNPWLLS
mgnify:CR=1 FL=1